MVSSTKFNGRDLERSASGATLGTVEGTMLLGTDSPQLLDLSDDYR